MGMADPMEESLAEGDANATPWSEAERRLANPQPAQTYWLATMRSDGRAHVMPLIGLWLDHAFYFITGEKTRKGKNLAGNPDCVITVNTSASPSLDIVIEGKGRRVTDGTTLQRVVDAYRSKMGWQLEVRGNEVFGPNAPTAGPPPYAVCEVKPETAFGFPGLGTDESQERHTPTRWRFQGSRIQS